MADEDRFLTGSGDVNPEQRSASYSTNTSFGPFSGGAILSGQDNGTPTIGGRFTTQLPEGLSATLSSTNQAGAPVEYARDAIRLAKQLEAGQLAFEASRTGSNGVPSYGLQYGAPIGKQGGATPYYPAPSGNWYVEAGGTPQTPERHVRGGARFNFADGGTVEAALHAIRHHLAGGGFLSDLFSGPDYLSTGEVASPTNWGDPESAADFFKADRAAQLAREVQASADDVTGSVPAREPLTAPRPGKVEVQELPVNIPFAAPERGAAMSTSAGPAPLSNFQTIPGAITPISSDFQRTAPQAEVNRAVSLARETIPSAAEALAAVEKLHNAGVYSGEALDKAGEILAAHNRAMFDNIPVEEALRLNRAAGPMMINQGMPREERPAVQPLAYTAAPTPAPAQAAIDQATGKLTARAPQGPDLTDRDRDLIIRTIAAETSGKTPEESQAIAHVILNRIQSGSYGDSPEAVLFAKNQFEPWSKPGGPNYPMRFSPDSRRYGMGQAALDAALGADDITGGATNFWAPKAQYALGRAAPAWGRTGGVDIGETRFHNLSRAEGGEVDAPTAPDGVDQALDVVRQQPVTPASLARAWTPPEEAIAADVGPRASEFMQTYPEKLGAAMAAMPGEMLETAKLPGQVLYGERSFDPHNDEDIRKAMDLAMMVQTGGLGGAPARAGETVLGSGPVRTSPATTIKHEGSGIYRVFHGDEPAGTISVAKNGAGNFVSAANLDEPFIGKGIGREAYNLIENEIGRKLAPSPLGISPTGSKFWQKRLNEMAAEEKANLFAQTREAGAAYGLPERDVNLRLFGIGGVESLPPIKRAYGGSVEDHALMLVSRQA